MAEDTDRKILLSIHPEYVDKIVRGTKKYEYRTKRAKGDISFLYIYETSPYKKVVCSVSVKDILELPIDELWEKTKDYSGMSKESFFNYFKGHEIGYAYVLGKISVYQTSKSLSDFNLRKAPQSFCYV